GVPYPGSSRRCCEARWSDISATCPGARPSLPLHDALPIYSDWSVAPVPGWAGRLVTVRASRAGDAVTVRARVDDEPFRLVRVAHLAPDAAVCGGLYCCSPTRAGLTLRVIRYARTGPHAPRHLTCAGRDLDRSS